MTFSRFYTIMGVIFDGQTDEQQSPRYEKHRAVKKKLA